MAYRDLLKKNRDWPKKFSQWHGRYVRLKDELQTLHGEKFLAGRVMRVDGLWRTKLHLVDPCPSDEGQSSGQGRYIRQVPLRNVILLGKDEVKIKVSLVMEVEDGLLFPTHTTMGELAQFVMPDWFSPLDMCLSRLNGRKAGDFDWTFSKWLTDLLGSGLDDRRTTAVRLNILQMRTWGQQYKDHQWVVEYTWKA